MRPGPRRALGDSNRCSSQGGDPALPIVSIVQAPLVLALGPLKDPSRPCPRHRAMSVPESAREKSSPALAGLGSQSPARPDICPPLQQAVLWPKVWTPGRAVQRPQSEPQPPAAQAPKGPGLGPQQSYLYSSEDGKGQSAISWITFYEPVPEGGAPLYSQGLANNPSCSKKEAGFSLIWGEHELIINQVLQRNIGWLCLISALWSNLSGQQFPVVSCRCAPCSALGLKRCQRVGQPPPYSPSPPSLQYFSPPHLPAPGGPCPSPSSHPPCTQALGL